MHATLIPASDLAIDTDLIRKHDKAGPRYTSYPTADRFVEAYGSAEHAGWLAARNIGGRNQPLSLYIHLPFCANICYYCACNKVITKDHGRSAKYVKYLKKEMDLVARQLQGRSPVTQLHWGGGTPTFLSGDEMTELMAITRDHFEFDPQGEYSLEIDPRSVSRETFDLLGRLGFNRVSIGVQDFEPTVQEAIHRIQSRDETRAAIEAARAVGMKSVNLDLIYGLPRQTSESFARTLDEVIRLEPDRIALYSYAHIPTLFKPQRRILPADMPSPEAKLGLLVQAINTLTAAGYVYIGMDHFARPDDELNIARRQGRLHRNFQGYSTRAECDLVALGISAISQVGPAYAQNVKTLDEYYTLLDAGELPIARGVELSADDALRRALIQALMCHFEVSIESIEIAHLIDFKRYFAAELELLEVYCADGLVTLDAQWITVTPKGRLLVRSIAMAFDKYVRQSAERQRFSKVI
ncbi:MAG: oxygen-independent coproporphyrinogen III oxidase [Betaproteobacteria bacterium]|nr:oxygen-independent coproporphyrinogen III oxidase [Betaproteobacteria bacterium]